MSDPPTSHRIRCGQIYESCQQVFGGVAGDGFVRIKVIEEPSGTFGVYGYGKVRVATLTEEGRELRPRTVEASQLHSSGTTNTGQPRKTGYRLIEEAADDGT